jgi:DNA-binding response OmpR family regulator
MTAMVEQEQEEALRLEGKKILVVDDDYEVRSALDHALQSEGALTQSCGDGNTAVRICDSDPPDLVVLDMMLPKRSGFLVLERVKRMAEQAPKVIMVTANEGRRHKQYAEDLGVDGYILKPVRLERLISMCQDLLDLPAAS